MDGIPILLTICILGRAVGADLPYSPTRIFYSAQHANKIVYILDPPSSSIPSGQLRSLSVASAIDSSSLSATTLSESLPFLSDATAPYAAALRADGSLVVFTGSCNSGPETSQVWLYNEDTSSQNGAGRWSNQGTDTVSSAISASGPGPAFLAEAASFAADASVDNANLYVFGGMCPFNNATRATWNTAAAYSNQMLVLQPDKSDNEYDFSITSSQGAPIAEAGFSLTPLIPSYSRNSSGGIISQQQNLLLLGGQTQSAFINMSQVALFSLPQASWSFYPIVQQASATALRLRETEVEVEPRSGHTAILSEDGSQVLIFGGWVGDISNAAEPQLAVLELGSGFGGSGAWSWKTPSSGNPLTSAVSLFGHGATLLPGNVMMITGGFSISSSSSTSSNEDLPANTQSLFYNITSSQWLRQYYPDGSDSAQADMAEGALSSKSQRTGFGVGLALGLVVVAAILVGVSIYWNRRQKRKRQREAKVRENELGGSDEIDDLWRLSIGQYSKLENPKIRSSSNEAGVASRHQASGSQDMLLREKESQAWNNLREAERTGLDVEIPSPHRGLRKGRPIYQSIPRQDDRSLSLRGAPMQPIQEQDETSSIDSRKRLSKPDTEDPFADPKPLSINTAIPSAGAIPANTATRHGVSPADERNREMQGWIRRWAAAEHDLKSGRTSPTKSERTISSLSERSVRSNLSSQSAGLLAGSSSAARSRNVGFSQEKADHELFWTPPTSPHRNMNIVTEGQNLLSRAGMTSSRSHDLLPDHEPTFTGRNQPVRSRSRLGGWVRKAVRPVPTTGRSSSMTASTAAPLGGLIDVPDAVHLHDGSLTSQSWMTAERPSISRLGTSSDPRRALSDGSNSCWASRAGARDWGAQARGQSRQPVPLTGPLGSDDTRPTRNEPQAGVNVRRTSDDDWDIEAASRERVVQVMFTVPREQLRVVNAEVSSMSDAGSENRRVSAGGYNSDDGPDGRSKGIDMEPRV